MTPTLDDIRTAGETKVAQLLAAVDEHAKAILRDALRRYGRVQDIPDSAWAKVKEHYADNDRLAVAIMILAFEADLWTIGEMQRHGVRVSIPSFAPYSQQAEDSVKSLDGTVDTIRNRLTQAIKRSRLEGPGELGELTEDGIDEAISGVFTDERIKTIATDQTTGAISGGQIGARDRTVGEDGVAETVDGIRMTVSLIWRTEKDNLVCPDCRPMEGKPEEIWSLVFPEGPGDDAHPNCRCYLEVRAVPFVESDSE